MQLSDGVRFMLIATFVFMVMKVCVKLIPHIPAIEIILFRSIISLVISYYFLARQNVSVWGNNKPILILRGASGAFALVTYFYLLQQIPLATAATLQYMAPIFATILGVFLVKEKVTPIQGLFFLISFAGVLIIQGFDARISYFHLGVGISSALGTALAYNFVRKLKVSEHPLVIIFYFPLVVMPIAIIWSGFVWVQPQGWDWLVLLAVGLCTQIAQYFMTRSYQVAEVSKVSILNYVGIIYALGFGWLFFDETFNLMTYAGMGLVLAGVILNVVIKKT
ncbi:MAG: drug/metabolite transporter (DMT)-like permease [Cyclobacteriaceae bacterium]|jgi:drug/metabolite transporter (DMT)-like permease